MMNGLQTLPHWQEYFKHPEGSMLGILNAIMSLGSLAALPAVPYTADILGRRMGILIGCLIMYAIEVVVLGYIVLTVLGSWVSFSRVLVPTMACSWLRGF
jgi:MFS family permease